MNTFLCAVVQIQRHEAPPGELHVPPESTAAQEQVSRLCYHSPCGTATFPSARLRLETVLKKKTKKNCCD